VFFDEIDAVVPVRSASGSDSRVAERVLSQFLAEFDGIDELKGVLVLGATNRVDMLDAAVLRPGRFDEIVEIPLPDEKSRAEIFAVHLRGKPLAGDIDADGFASRTEGFSGAEIAAICNRAALTAVRRAVEVSGGEPDESAAVSIDKDDLDRAAREIADANKF
jgi:transitional endoplasmic reticulum ATPase